MKPRYRQTCRVCGSDKLKKVIDLGEQFLQGSFVKEGYIQPPLRKLPTLLVRCDVESDEKACGLVQLAHSFPPEILYANYWYKSGTNQTMKNHLKNIVDNAVGIVSRQQLAVLDIGCNDGTLLSCYPEQTVMFGVDPSDIARTIPSPVNVINTVFPSEMASSKIQPSSLDIVTSIAMFYDLEDPVGFASSIKTLLKGDGIWIFEMLYLPMMLEMNSFDTICHEHIEYYSLSSLEEILSRAGMRIFKAELNNINGGSIRCYATHASNHEYDSAESKDILTRLRIREFEMELDTDKPYIEFQKRIEALKSEFEALIFKLKSEKKSIHIYGASTKGNVLVQWYGLNKLLIDCAADRNPDKVGAITLGTEIPIVSEEESRAMKPDFYLVLPWHFKREFLMRERATIMAGTGMIFPLPQIQIVTHSNVDQILKELEQETTMFG